MNLSSERRREELTGEISEDPDQLKVLNQETSQSIEMNWYGKNIKIQRIEYLDIPGFIEMFTRY